MNMKELVYKNRSYRRFDEGHAISLDTLRDLADLGRMSPNGRNIQALRYILSADKERNELVFETLGWAAYLKDWNGPSEGERPSAYIVMLNEAPAGSNTLTDSGIAAQSILLGATELGLGGCMFRNVNRERLASRLNIPKEYEVLMVIALGKPVEVISVDEVGPDGDIRYWRDEKMVHHLPKRSLEDVILKI